MSARAGILVTGTEVLTGRVVDRNGPWLSDRLRELGVDHAHTIVVGDRPEDMTAALRFLRDEGMDVIVTSGGLGPTADDLTADIVGEFQGREMVLDEPTEARIAEILRPMLDRFPNLDLDAVREGNRKQAIVPRGAAILAPVGTAPGLVVPPSDGTAPRPTIVVLPGPPRELQAMWPDAVARPELRAAIAGAEPIDEKMLRLFGIPESEIAATLRAASKAGIDLDALEITTCMRNAEIEVVTRFAPSAAGVYERFEDFVREQHHDTLFSEDGSSVDEQVAALLRGDESRAPLRLAVAESCTGGLLAGRITNLAGSSEYFPGGVVVYENEAKEALAGVPHEVLVEHGAVSGETARALADGARRALRADIGVGVTGVAGPGGGTPGKPVGLVWFCVSSDSGSLTRRVQLPGGRSDVRERSTTVALHLVRRLLLGEHDA